MCFKIVRMLETKGNRKPRISSKEFQVEAKVVSAKEFTDLINRNRHITNEEREKMLNDIEAEQERLLK